MIRYWKQSLAALALLMGCGGATPNVGPAELDRSVAHYYPLATGNAWAYDVTDGDRERGFMPVTVQAASAGRYELLMAGTEVTYRRRDDGLFDERNGVYVLREPLEVGTTWEARGQRQAEIVDIEARVETPAGTFEHCVQVAERGEGDTSVDNYFCPGIGIARVRIEVRTQLRQQTVINDAVLRTMPILQ